MDQLDEQRLREEVIFLHSLWYQGPPRPAYPATAVSAYRHHLQPLWYQGPPVPAVTRPTTTAVSGNRYHLQPSKSTKFKKGQKRKGKRGTILPNNPPDPNSSHGAEWPCPATPPPPTSWPAACRPTTDPLPLIPEEQSKLDSKGAHQRALKAVREFFSSNSDDGSDKIDSGDDNDGDETTDDDCGREEFNFFCKVFENTGFRECYEKNFITGEFSCLVCGVVGGKKTTKKFKGCLSLVQHSIAIGNMKRRRAHRALAQAVCKILGWDINRLPEIVSMLSNKLGNTRGNGNGDNKESSEAFVCDGDSAKDDTADDKDDEATPASDGGRNLEDIGILQSMCNVEEPASDALTMPLEATQLGSESNSSHLPSTSGWPTTNWATFEKSNVKPLLLSAEEQLIVAGRHAHEHAIKVVHEFFSTSNSDDSDEIERDSDDDDDEADLMEEDSGSEECSFFFKVFEDDTKLREYYLKNFADGEFSCVVCGAMGGKKTGKKFKGCLPLVQHSITICKTKKRKAHRAFGRAVCKVLGWDIDRLPTVESMRSDKAGNTAISLTHADGDKDLEHPGMGHEKITEEPASQDLTIVPLNNEQSHGE